MSLRTTSHLSSVNRDILYTPMRSEDDSAPGELDEIFDVVIFLAQLADMPTQKRRKLKTCKQCGRMANSNSQKRCECGYDFTPPRRTIRQSRD